MWSNYSFSSETKWEIAGKFFLLQQYFPFFLMDIQNYKLLHYLSSSKPSPIACTLNCIFKHRFIKQISARYPQSGSWKGACKLFNIWINMYEKLLIDVWHAFKAMQSGEKRSEKKCWSENHAKLRRVHVEKTF